MADLRESAVGPAQLACNGGNGVIRTPTRRRHAGGRLHMAQKPLCRSAWRAARGLLGGRLRRRWAVAGQAANGRPTGGWCEACWSGSGCGAGGWWQGRWVRGRPTGGRREACWVGWLRCRWVAAGPGRASRSTTPSEARVWRSRGRAAAHRRTEQPRARRRGQASRRTEVWRREAAQNSHGQASRAHAELG